MVAKRLFSCTRGQNGVSLIEVLVTLVILAFGLLGLVGLQTRLQSSEMESYQRSQALLLLNDMANRITVNRANATQYVTSSALGVDVADCSTLTKTNATAQSDAIEWCSALQGAGEVVGSNKVGAMIGGRGCVEDLGSGRYFVTVAWQGLTPMSAPPTAVTCGEGLYDTAGSSCVNDICRRTVTTLVRIADL